LNRRKRFFFEKKNQKTFKLCACWLGRRALLMTNAILVIRLGALGDFFLSFPAFADIRAHHAADRVVLLTTPPFAALARESPWFDEVRVDTRPAWFDLPGLWQLRRQLRGFDFVYDLQTSRRSSRYFRLAGSPPWSGIARGCSHPDAAPRRNFLHSVDRQRGQLAAANVPASGGFDTAWLAGRGPVIEGRYALLVPATSGSHGGAKTWPAERYAALARLLWARGLRPVVVGTAAETGAARQVLVACPEAIDMTGKTSIQDLAGLAARAALTVGGDTGPVHVAGVMGCRVVALFSRFSDVAQAGPIGARVLKADRVEEITLRMVADAVAAF
jgi:ADP-heptose:LPS heptosyltransferase